MEIIFHKKFYKYYNKRSIKEQRKFDESLVLFTNDSFNPVLNNHALDGQYKDYYSINITGDLRALYKVKDEYVVFWILDTHSNLYD